TDVDQQQGHEADGVGEQRHQAGNEQLTEGHARSRQCVSRLARCHGDAVDLLYPVGNTDGEYQERHQHRVGVETEAQGVQQPQLPDHRNQRGDDHRQGALEAVGEPQQQHEGDADGHGEEQCHADQAVDQITDLLGETDDVHFHIRVLRLVLVADLLFQLVGERLVVESDQPALVFRVRIGLQQRNVDDAGLEVVRHQAADLTRLEDVAAQVLEAVGRTVIGLRNHLTTGETFFGHFGPAYARTPQRFQAGTVNTGNVEGLVMDLPQRLHVFLAEDVAIGGFYGNAHRVAQVGQVITVLEHFLNIGMPQRNHLLEAGLRPHLCSLIEQEDADQQADQDHRRAIVEDQPFEE